MTPVTDPILSILKAYIAANEAVHMGEVPQDSIRWDAIAQEMATQMAIGLVSVPQELAQALEATRNAAGCWCPSLLTAEHTSCCVLARRALTRAQLLSILSEVVKGRGSAEELLARATEALVGLL